MKTKMSEFEKGVREGLALGRTKGMLDILEHLRRKKPIKRFGHYLREIREFRGLTLRQVQDFARISNSYLSQIENNQRPSPHLPLLSRLSKMYGIKLSEIVDKWESLQNE